MDHPCWLCGTGLPCKPKPMLEPKLEPKLVWAECAGWGVA